MIDAISPIDGRYRAKTEELCEFFSEGALIRYRIIVEVEYLKFLSEIGIINLTEAEVTTIDQVKETKNLSRVKAIEKITNHDVKAVEYFIKEEVKGKISDTVLEYIHLGLTSQDVNNTAMPMMLKDGIQKVMVPRLHLLLGELTQMAEQYKEIPLLARTHGQAASPTSLGKEMMVYVDRLTKQIKKLEQHRYEAKFGGATGNFNAHMVAFPDKDWRAEINRFISTLDLDRQQYTTQIDQYDNIAEVLQIISRIDTILIDFARDIWTYVSRDFFKQKVIAGEVGSSAMPHKVNPIDFENAEGNLGLARSLYNYLAQKLPISRLQRDLTDSTVTRNLGVPLAHSLIAYKSLMKGISKLEVNRAAIKADLDGAWPVISEGIQTILRREGFEAPYELLKSFSRGKGKLTQEDFRDFIDGLDVDTQVKEELLRLSPHTYVGYSMGD